MFEQLLSHIARCELSSWMSLQKRFPRACRFARPCQLSRLHFLLPFSCSRMHLFFSVQLLVLVKTRRPIPLCTSENHTLIRIDRDGRPQKAIANRIKGFKAKHFKGKTVIGMQVLKASYHRRTLALTLPIPQTRNLKQSASTSTLLLFFVSSFFPSVPRALACSLSRSENSCKVAGPPANERQRQGWRRDVRCACQDVCLAVPTPKSAHLTCASTQSSQTSCLGSVTQAGSLRYWECAESKARYPARDSQAPALI